MKGGGKKNFCLCFSLKKIKIYKSLETMVVRIKEKVKETQGRSENSGQESQRPAQNTCSFWGCLPHRLLFSCHLGNFSILFYSATPTQTIPPVGSDLKQCSTAPSWFGVGAVCPCTHFSKTVLCQKEGDVGSHTFFPSLVFGPSKGNDQHFSLLHIRKRSTQKTETQTFIASSFELRYSTI